MKYILRSTDFKYGTITWAELNSLLPPQALMVALKRLGLAWLGCIVCLPLPGIHFVLVPGFFFVGIFLFFQAIKFKAKLVGVETICPVCQTKVLYKTLYLADEKNVFCKNCRTQLRILNEPAG